MKQLKLAIVGCGAVTRIAHLPVSAEVPDLKVEALVDPNLSRAEQLSREFKVPHAFPDTTRLRELVDAAIIAAPHALHAPITIELLQQGIHVLVEKPMALTIAECDEMIQAAERNGTVLAVGLMRRFAPWARFVKKTLALGILGPIRSFDIREGGKYNWPVVSDFFFKKETAGGGVLIDTGAHTLDTVLWWFPKVEEFEYFDDAEGGVEANCEVHLKMEDGVSGVVTLSRTRNLGFCIRIHGERGDLELEPNAPKVKLTVGGYQLSGCLSCILDPEESGEYLTLMRASLRDWVQAIRNGTTPAVSGQEGRSSIALIESCYRERQPLVYPWVDQRKPALIISGNEVER